jgi:hypothetical protein
MIKYNEIKYPNKKQLKQFDYSAEQKKNIRFPQYKQLKISPINFPR